MIINGREIADQIYRSIKDDITKLGRTPRLGVLVCAPNFETKKYLELKQSKAMIAVLSNCMI